MKRDPFKNNRALESIARRMEDGEKEIITKLDPGLIDEHPDNEYLFGMPREGIESLKKAMKKPDGTVVCDAPILVWDTENGRYMAYSGHMRKRAFVEAGGEKIPAIVRKMPDETMQRRMLLGANIYGRNVNPVNSKDPIHTARQINYMKATLVMEGYKGSMREQLAIEFQTSGSTIQRYESFFKLPGDVQEKVQNGELPDTVAQAMGNMESGQVGRTVEALERLKEEEGGKYFTRDNALKIVSEAKKEGDIEGVVDSMIHEAEEKPAALKSEYEEPRLVHSDEHEESGSEAGQQIAFSDLKEFDDNVLNALHITESWGKEEEETKKLKNLENLNSALQKMEEVLTGNNRYPDSDEVKDKLKHLIMLASEEIERVGQAI